MKKIMLIFTICLLVSGCGKTEKNVTINIYENSDKEVIKEEIKNEDNEKTTVVEKQEIIVIKEKDNEQVSSSNTQSNTNENSNEESILDKVTDKVKDTYNGAKDWYNTNKDELKDINGEIVENDKNTINGWIGKAKNWYEENKNELKNSAEEVYNNDKQTIEDLYNKIKN